MGNVAESKIPKAGPHSFRSVLNGSTAPVRTTNPERARDAQRVGKSHLLGAGVRGSSRRRGRHQKAALLTRSRTARKRVD